ncbi:hypothetical protein WJX81_007324 [Elliptochloris bilobata]|uniref:Cytochrome P450 n=1 Tax=Elliptochloris bilobata TaxID=381761 RepID=A0AAW1SHX3_9CHLO
MSMVFGDAAAKNAIKVGQQEFGFTANKEGTCDVVHLPPPGSGAPAVEVACLHQRLHVQRTLDEVERLRARERGQEAERQLKQRKLLRLEAAPRASKPVKGAKVVQRGVTPPAARPAPPAVPRRAGGGRGRGGGRVAGTRVAEAPAAAVAGAADGLRRCLVGLLGERPYKRQAIEQVLVAVGARVPGFKPPGKEELSRVLRDVSEFRAPGQPVAAAGGSHAEVGGGNGTVGGDPVAGGAAGGVIAEPVAGGLRSARSASSSEYDASWFAEHEGRSPIDYAPVASAAQAAGYAREYGAKYGVYFRLHQEIEANRRAVKALRASAAATSAPADAERWAAQAERLARRRKLCEQGLPVWLVPSKQLAPMWSSRPTQDLAKHKVFKVFFGAHPVVVVADAEVGRAINLSCPMRPEILGPMQLVRPEDNILGRLGILPVKDRLYHRSLRAAWQPAMLQKSLQNYAALMNASVERTALLLEPAARAGTEINLFALLGGMSMDVVGTAAFGVDFRTQDNASMDPEAQRLVDAAITMFRVSDAGASAYMLPLVCAPFLAPLLRFLAAAFPDAGMRKLVAAQRRRLARGLTVQTAQTFLLGGYESTAAGIAFTCYLLSTSPDKQAKLLKEVDAAGGQGAVSASDLERFPYVDACLRETLRLFPPGHITVRCRGPLRGQCARRWRTLELRGMRVPKGTWIHVALCAIHRDPDIWRQPGAFMPERWVTGAPEAANECEKKAWMAIQAFGDDARSCVGKRFAAEEAKIAMIRLFIFSLSPGQAPLQLASPFTLAPKHGIFVTPQLRAS